MSIGSNINEIAALDELSEGKHLLKYYGRHFIYFFENEGSAELYVQLNFVIIFYKINKTQRNENNKNNNIKLSLKGDMHLAYYWKTKGLELRTTKNGPFLCQ